MFVFMTEIIGLFQMLHTTLVWGESEIDYCLVLFDLLLSSFNAFFIGFNKLFNLWLSNKRESLIRIFLYWNQINIFSCQLWEVFFARNWTKVLVLEGQCRHFTTTVTLSLFWTRFLWGCQFCGKYHKDCMSTNQIICWH
jgi:hypothetical protein